MKQQNEIPKDLKVKIGTEKEVFWTKVRDAADQAVKDCQNTIMLQEAVRDMAKKEIEKEQHLNSLKA